VSDARKYKVDGLRLTPLTKLYFKATSSQARMSKSEPMTQAQADSVLTREQLPNLGFRIGVSLVLLVLLLVVAVLYHGIINP